jgi:hypothetical protein
MSGPAIGVTFPVFPVETGNFSIFPPKLSFGRKKTPQNQYLAGKFPCRPNREFTPA